MCQEKGCHHQGFKERWWHRCAVLRNRQRINGVDSSPFFGGNSIIM